MSCDTWKQTIEIYGTDDFAKVINKCLGYIENQIHFSDAHEQSKFLSCCLTFRKKALELSEHHREDYAKRCSEYHQQDIKEGKC